MEKIKEKWHITIIVIGIIFISLGAFHTNTWFDENYSIDLAKYSFKEIWQIGGNDVHPILYYWVLHIIYLLTGGSILAYRLFSIIPIAIMIILGYTHIRKDFGEKTGYIFSFLSAFLPVMSLYAIEIRMYSLSILTVTLLAIYAYRLAQKDNIKNWTIFGISSLASIYLHYYGLMAAGLINLALLIYLIIKKRKKGIIFILLWGLVQLITYLPWLISLATQIDKVSTEFWIEFIFPKTQMEILSSQLAGYIDTQDDYTSLLAPTAVSIVLYAYLIYSTYKYYKQKQNLKPFLWSVGIYLGVIGASLIITEILKAKILYYRYLFVITGFYIFAISFILGKEKNNTITVTILLVIACFGIYNNFHMIKDNYSRTNGEFIQYLEENIQEGDTILYTNSGVGKIKSGILKGNRIYFYNKYNWIVEEAYKAFGSNFETYTSTEFIGKCSNRIWIIEESDFDTNVEELFKETQYKTSIEKEFSIDYHDYNYKITLVEN